MLKRLKRRRGYPENVLVGVEEGHVEEEDDDREEQSGDDLETLEPADEALPPDLNTFRVVLIDGRETFAYFIGIIIA